MIKRLLQFFRKPVPDKRTPAQRMLTLHRAKVYYLPITKCGSTYLKNLFYYLDNAAEHRAGDNIHSTPRDLLRARSGAEEEIRQSPYAFLVLRNPVDRFISLYFDKIYGDGPQNFAQERAYLAREIGLDLTRNLGADVHRENCNRLIDWFALNLANKTDQEINHHWRRQSKRLARVKGLELTHLTLDGLDWQLPQILGDALPDIEQAMATVKAANQTPKTVKPADILDAALIAKIETVYPEDKQLYDAASQNWQARAELAQFTSDKNLKVMTASPLYCVTTPKVGCTYLKNLFYYLNNGITYSDPLRIHAGSDTPDDAVENAEVSWEDLNEGISFFVVRDPVSRFFSLYFDKVYNTGPQSFEWIGKRLAEKRGYVGGPDISLEQHRINCIALLGYIRYQLANTKHSKVNAHWRPQVEAARNTAEFNLLPLLLENLDEQLVQIADGRVPGLKEAINAVSTRNVSTKPFTNAEIMTPEIARRISTLYGDDQALYEQIKTGWAKTGQPPKL